MTKMLMKKTYDSLVAKYGEQYVISSFDEKLQDYIDICDRCDMYCIPIPYEENNHPLYRPSYLNNLGLLSFYTGYGYDLTSKWSKIVYATPCLNTSWRVFIENPRLQIEYDLGLKNLGMNTIAIGYPKMDALASIPVVKRSRKKIIIAPHHTVGKEWGPVLALGNFLKYSELFLKLPKLYPEIDFVFRPHPLLFYSLSKPELWGQEKSDQYLKDMCANPNVEYQNGGDYFATFVNSDGIIHDCGSFTAEYLYVNKPCCYMLKEPIEGEQYFNAFAKKLLSAYYKAYDEDAILSFIEKVVIKGDDPKQDVRSAISQKVRYNYPNVSLKIVDYIKQSFNQR